jgi:hypothetical protein
MEVHKTVQKGMKREHYFSHDSNTYRSSSNVIFSFLEQTEDLFALDKDQVIHGPK